MATTNDVPFRYPVAIDGVPYQIDARGFRRRSVQVLREQGDTTTEIGEASLNRRGLWRRSQDSWHHGGGQDSYDGKVDGTAADSERYNISTGADPWTRGRISNLPKFTRIRASGTQVIAVGNHAYIIDGNEVYWATGPLTTGSSWTSATIQAGQAAQTPRSLATNGNYVWAAMGTSGLHRTAKGLTATVADVPAAPGSGNISLVGFALGRLLVAGSETSTSARNTLWEVVDPLSTPSLATGLNGLKYTHPDPNFVWLGISPGRNCVYCFGMVPAGPINLNLGLEYGGQAEIYRIIQNPATTGLNEPILASYLPDGESVHALQFYAGGVTMGTSRGIRVAAVDGPGNLDYGPLVKTPYPVTALEPQDRYVWFGMPRQTAPSGTTQRRGLGRVDLGFFADTLTPAWSQDVAATVPDEGNITSIATIAGVGTGGFLGNLVFAMNSGGFSTDPRGIYAVELDGVLQVRDTLDVETGVISFSTTEAKTLRSVEVRHSPIPVGDGALTVYYRVNGDDTWTSAGTNAVDGSVVTSLGIGGATGLTGVETVELRYTYVPASGETDEFALLRTTLFALPTPERKASWVIPLLLRPKVESNLGDIESVDISARKAALEALEQDGTVFEFQCEGRTLQGFVEDSEFQGEDVVAEADGSTEERVIAGVHTVIVTEV